MSEEIKENILETIEEEVEKDFDKEFAKDLKDYIYINNLLTYIKVLGNK